ncbi:DNA translocase FtsK, partial [bacterium]|nr:DNA translocase FtsK [bacterium]
ADVSLPRLAVLPDLDDYQFPPLGLLDPGGVSSIHSKENVALRQEQAAILEDTLASFGVAAKVVNVTPGPSVTRYELSPGVGVKVAKITSLSKDIALKLAAPDVRIEAPIPGKALVGIEVPNRQTESVTLRALLEKTTFYTQASRLVAGMGLTITGEPVLMDLAKMPHVLIAGATGAGKSVCVNTFILSVLLRAKPDEVKFLMIDPKKVELSLYDGIPHLVAPVVTDPNKAAATLNKWALVEMERRYETFSKVGVKHIEGYNQWVLEKGASLATDDTHVVHQTLPYIVVIIDELADLMMVASSEVESTICRLAQMSRATGIHLVIATQRPSVDVVTGLIKANVPSRISFFLQSQIDSRTILDMPGAEKLLGKGDMLYSPVGAMKPQRVQGVYVSEREVKAVVGFLKAQASPSYIEAVLSVEPLESESKPLDPDQDELYEEAKQIIMNTQYASTSYLQRKLRIGYNRAARLMESLERQGVVSQYAQDRKKPLA